MIYIRVLHRRLTSGEIFTDMLSLKRNRLLFSGNVLGGQGFDGGVKFVIEDYIPPLQKPCKCS